MKAENKKVILLKKHFFTTHFLRQLQQNRLKKWIGDIFVIIKLKKVLYDTHSNMVVETRLRMCVGHKNYDRFY